MAFSQNHSLTHIDVQEANLLGISRSSQTTIPSDKRCHGHPCDAFVCTLKEGELLRVHVALYDLKTKLALIFSSECDARESAVFRKLTADAEEFAVSLGFSLEPVNLNYSAAMRQVIMRGISVLQPPDPIRLNRKVSTVSTAQPEAPHLSPPTPSSAQTSRPPCHNATASPVAELQTVPPVVNPATVSVEEHAALRHKLEKLAREKAAAEILSEKALKDMSAQLKGAIVARTAAETALQQRMTQLSDQEQSLADQLARLEAELGRTECFRESAEQTCAEASAQRSAAEAALLEGHARLKSVETEASERMQALESRLVTAQAATRTAENGLAAERKLRREATAAAEEQAGALHVLVEGLRSQVAELQDALKAGEAERDALKVGLESASADLAAAHHDLQAQWHEERAALERRYEERNAAYNQLAAELAEARTAHENAVVEMELERQQVVGDLQTVTSKLEGLSAEKKVWDSISLNFQKKARSAVERLRREKRALEEQLGQMVKNRAAAEQVSAGPEKLARVAAPKEPVSTEGFSLGPAFTGFAASTSGSAADFRFKPEIKAVSYYSAEEILDIYGSGNLIQTAPFGRRSQNCSAYICVVERAGRSEVHLAWVLVDSGEVLICLPEQQPEGKGNHTRMVQDALFYFESVGFMMNRFELSRGSERQIQALEKTGIFRREERRLQEDPWLMIAAA